MTVKITESELEELLSLIPTFIYRGKEVSYDYKIGKFQTMEELRLEITQKIKIIAD